jgi:hypothetical protein
VPQTLGVRASADTPPAARAPGRRKFIGFVSDQASAELLHTVLEPVFPIGNELHVVGFRAALNLLAGMKTPEIVLIHR